MIAGESRCAGKEGKGAGACGLRGRRRWRGDAARQKLLAGRQLENREAVEAKFYPSLTTFIYSTLFTETVGGDLTPPLLPAATALPRASFRISRRRARDGTSRGLKKRGLGANREALVYAWPRHGPRASLSARRWMSSTWEGKKL